LEEREVGGRDLGLLETGEDLAEFSPELALGIGRGGIHPLGKRDRERPQDPFRPAQAQIGQEVRYRDG
jgi:hypothetical protein